ncbi:MAG: hypothetical protein ACI8SJ_002247, partial [Shewanella sp.]
PGVASSSLVHSANTKTKASSKDEAFFVYVK